MKPVSRRRLIKSLVGLGVAGAIGYTLYPYAPSPPSPSSSSSTKTDSFQNPSNFPDVLDYHGMVGRGVCAYTDPFHTSTGTFGGLGPMAAYYLSQNFTIYPNQDSSNGLAALEFPQILAAYKAAHGIVLCPTYGWDYAEQFYDPLTGNTNAATLWPSELQYYYVNATLMAGPLTTVNGSSVIAVGTKTIQLVYYSGFPGYRVGSSLTIDSRNAPETAIVAGYTAPVGTPGQTGFSPATVTLQSGLQQNHKNHATVSDGNYFQTPGQSFISGYVGFYGIVIDAPELVSDAYPPLFKQIPLGKGVAGTAGWVNSDHGGPNPGGAQGAPGGLNMRAFTRYVNNLPGLPTNYYLLDVNSAGQHNADGTPCALWSLRGHPDNFTAANCEPSLAMSADATNYHHGFGNSTQNPQGQTIGTSSLGLYYQKMNARLEQSLFNTVAASVQGFAFQRTQIPATILQGITPSGQLLEMTTASIYSIGNSTPIFVNPPYMNLANADDNGSNLGRTSIDEVATAATVTDFWTVVVPALGADCSFVEADTDPSFIVEVVNATGWTAYATSYSKLTLDGLYNYQPKNQMMRPAQFFISDRGLEDEFDKNRTAIVNLLGRQGRPKQLWFVNPTEEEKSVSIKLPASLLDMRNPGRSIELITGRVTDTGGNEAIEASLDMKRKSWGIIEVPCR